MNSVFVFKLVLKSGFFNVSREETNGFLDVYTEVFVLNGVVDKELKVGAHIGCHREALQNLDIAVEHSVFHVVIPTDNWQRILWLKHE